MLFITVGLTLSACGTMVPGPLSGNDFADVSPQMAQTRPDVRGLRVRWGGSIASVSPRKGDTCFEVVSHPLDDSARPQEDDNTNGRFIACLSGFYDPEIYAVKREITVVGTIQTPTIGKIGDYDYIFPHVAVETLYLWPKEVPIANDPSFDFGPNPFMYQAEPWLMGPMEPMAPWAMPW